MLSHDLPHWTSGAGVPEWVPASLVLIQLPAIALGKTLKDGSNAQALSPIWETRMEFPFPAHIYSLKHLGEWAIGLKTSFSFSVSPAILLFSNKLNVLEKSYRWYAYCNQMTNYLCTCSFKQVGIDDWSFSRTYMMSALDMDKEKVEVGQLTDLKSSKWTMACKVKQVTIRDPQSGFMN